MIMFMIILLWGERGRLPHVALLRPAEKTVSHIGDGM
jgi:hypothetical protein